MELRVFETPQEVNRYIFDIDDLTTDGMNAMMKFFQLLGRNTTYNPLFNKDIIYRSKGVDRHELWKYTVEMMKVWLIVFAYLTMLLQASAGHPFLLVAMANYILVHHREIVHEQEKSIEERISEEVEKRMRQMNALPGLQNENETD